MWIALELVFHSYGPDEIEPGTLYMNLLYVGTDKELVEVFALDKNTADLANKRLVNIDEYGYPVRPFLLNEEGVVIIPPDEIGWFDHPNEPQLQEFTTKEKYSNSIVQLIKKCPIRINSTRDIEQAISTSGGISMDEVDDNFMLNKLHNHYAIGEMLDWDTITGGYLLQACFSMAHRVSKL